ncbi:hypothetical protein SDC9_82483 [bioreactor metagenome]|uniref:Uncharacterized protein n=1 Tax=bioreactor metagenome TaxID=1076179 RepID=A0A644Z5M7_9ZZZZ
MTTPFREHLVLDVHSRGACPDELFGDPHGVDGVSVARVSVGHDGDIDCIHDIPGEFEHFSEGNKRHVGKPEEGRGEAETADLDCLEACLFDEFCGNGVMGAGHRNCFSFLKHLAKHCGFFHNLPP